MTKPALLMAHARRRLGGPRADLSAGNAMLEFVALSVVLLVPFVYFLLTVFAVQRASFGVTQAAREAGRALATSDSVSAGMSRATIAAELALADQGVSARATVTAVGPGQHCSAKARLDAVSLDPGARFTVCVFVNLPLPYTDRGLFHLAHTAIGLSASSLVAVDSYRNAPAR